jgi:hypothetical protein
LTLFITGASKFCLRVADRQTKFGFVSVRSKKNARRHCDVEKVPARQHGGCQWLEKNSSVPCTSQRVKTLLRHGRANVLLGCRAIRSWATNSRHPGRLLERATSLARACGRRRPGRPRKPCHLPHQRGHEHRSSTVLATLGGGHLASISRFVFCGVTSRPSAQLFLWTGRVPGNTAVTTAAHPLPPSPCVTSSSSPTRNRPPG